MEVFEAIEKRRTSHKFLEVPVEWEKVGNILMGGHYAPSAGNIQSWRFVVVTDKEARKGVADACLQQYWMEDAPVHIIIGSDPHEMERFYDEKGELYDIQSAAAAAQNMLLLAEDQGLSACWVGAFDERMLKRALDMPDNIKPHMVLVIGYSDEKPAKPEKYHISDITYINQWGSKIENMELVLENWSAVTKQKVEEASEAIKKGVNKHVPEVKDDSKVHVRKIHETLKLKFQKHKEKRELEKNRKKIEKAKKAFKKSKK